jgi:hypothetical protein
MTPDAFTNMAARLGPGVQVRTVLDAVQFRVSGRAFATLGWPAEGWAVVKLNRSDQARALASSEALTVEPGRRRRTGVTLVRLKAIDETAMAEVLAAAWREAYRPDHGRSAEALGAASTAAGA